MTDLSNAVPEPDAPVIAIATLYCRPCWQAGVATSIVLQVPTWAKLDDWLPAMCPKCIVRPSMPLLAEEQGIFVVAGIRLVSVSE